MKRVRAGVPRFTALKGVWQYVGRGRKLRFIPACACSKGMRHYARPMTRLALWREATMELRARRRRKLDSDNG